MTRKNLRLERMKQRREDNKLFILKTAEKIIAQKGYSSASMDDIAEEAQFSKATLYRYFTSKAELFVEVIVNSLEEINKEMRKIQELRKNAEEKIKEVIRHRLQDFEEREDLYRIFIAGKTMQLKGIEKKFLSRIRTKKREGIEVICEILASGQKNGEFQKMDVLDAVFILEALLHSFYFGKLWREKTYSLEKRIDLIHSHFLHGIKKKNKIEKET